MSICQEKLLKSIQEAHRALLAYSNCICVDATEEEKEVFYQFGHDLAVQLQELRAMYVKRYGNDPLNGYRIQSVGVSCHHSSPLD